MVYLLLGQIYFITLQDSIPYRYPNSNIGTGEVQHGWFIVGTLGCVFLDNEAHESGVTKCMTGEACSAFIWHHSDCVSMSMNTQPIVPAYTTHADLKCANYINSCDKIRMCFHIKICMKWIDETICYCLCLIVIKWSLWLQQVIAMVASLWYHTPRWTKLSHNSCWP